MQLLGGRVRGERVERARLPSVDAGDGMDCACAGFAGKVCVITGAGAGLGRNLAIELARAGAFLELWDIRADGLDQTRSSLSDTAHAEVGLVDVGDWNAVSVAAEEVARRR